jgi:hypothetical protein
MTELIHAHRLLRLSVGRRDDGWGAEFRAMVQRAGRGLSGLRRAPRQRRAESPRPRRSGGRRGWRVYADIDALWYRDKEAARARVSAMQDGRWGLLSPIGRGYEVPNSVTRMLTLSACSRRSIFNVMAVSITRGMYLVPLALKTPMKDRLSAHFCVNQQSPLQPLFSPPSTPAH